RRFVGARELLHDAPRWCLWLEDLDPSDVDRSEVLRGRLQAVREYREASRRAATNKLADTPALFGERRQPSVPYDSIPAHFSATRRFIAVAHFDPDVISGNANFTAEDASGLLFGIISSSMFIAWQRATGGRIKSDLRFSATVVWNNLPLPEVTEKQREQVIAGGKAVLEARALHPERSLAQHYAPLAMEPALLKAHRTLDAAVDKAFGAKRTCKSEQERQRVLFERYAEMVQGSIISNPHPRHRAREQIGDTGERRKLMTTNDPPRGPEKDDLNTRLKNDWTAAALNAE